MVDVLQDLLLFVLWIAIGATVLGLVGLALLHRRLRRIHVPRDAGLATTLRMVPLSLVIVLDLLDLGLDIFATPIVWVVLSRYRLHALRNTAAIEALVPMTQALPTMTLAWIGVRLLEMGAPVARRRVMDAEEIAPGQFVPRVERGQWD
jgi:hypothetical protein